MKVSADLIERVSQTTSVTGTLLLAKASKDAILLNRAGPGTAVQNEDSGSAIDTPVDQEIQVKIEQKDGRLVEQQKDPAQVAKDRCVGYFPMIGMHATYGLGMRTIGPVVVWRFVAIISFL